MKRSEMVKKIYNYILHECGDSSDLTHQHNSKIDAEAIMEIIEEAGMQPPRRVWPIHEVLNPALPMMSNTWGPEDET